MAHPYYHALSSVKKFGGVPSDYQHIHDWFDQTKGYMPDCRHRSILHSSTMEQWLTKMPIEPWMMRGAKAFTKEIANLTAVQEAKAAVKI